MFVVTVEFAPHEDCFAALREAVIANARASREKEGGCRQFDVSTDPDAGHTIFLYELYDDRAAFEAHLASAHYREFEARVAGWIQRKIVRLYQRLDPA
jgi:(4S)-4-hydroxy-5-phosphonooxypentane-2,3-dione isomerase